MEIRSHEFALLDILDRSGCWRSTAGCSLLGREEFFARLQQLQAILQESPPEQSLLDLWVQSSQVRRIICRCLELNGLDPDDFTLGQAQELLLAPGRLVELNLPPQSDAPSTGEAPTTATTLAALATHCGLREAFALAADPTVPANRLLAVVEAKAGLARKADPEARRRDQAKAWQKKARKDLALSKKGETR